MQFRHDQPEKLLRQLASAPFIYGMIVPIAFLHLCLEIYHHVAFRLYGLPLINRRKYIKIDRHKLSYLNAWEKVNCVYCGYANGFATYFVAICAATEAYWCGIMHKKDGVFVAPEHHKDFLPYNDEEAFNTFIKRK